MTGFFGRRKRSVSLVSFFPQKSPVGPVKSFNGNATTTGRTPEPSHSGELIVKSRNPKQRHAGANVIRYYDWDDWVFLEGERDL
jgi:hypothetical protein